ncbi:hypothetical protein EC991_007010 [Linnemannia zychae]|nr:hypothetical protein EC991_007010 [Linnemannia zychae]
MSAAFDSGVAFTGLLSFFIFTIRGKDMVEWWGTRYDLCPLESSPYIPAAVLPDAAA